MEYDEVDIVSFLRGQREIMSDLDNYTAAERRQSAIECIEEEINIPIPSATDLESGKVVKVCLFSDAVFVCFVYV